MATFSGLSVKAEDIKEFIIHIIKMNIANVSIGKATYPVTIWGHKGIGKTAILRQLVTEGIVEDLIYIPLAQVEEMGDLLGIPEPDVDPVSGKRVTVVRPPHWVPTKDVVGLVVLDDFNRADIRIIKGVMQLLQTAQMLTWKLPPRYTVVLTANPDDKDYLVTSIDPAMYTRMFNITMLVDPMSWLRWADRNNIDRRILSFIAKAGRDFLSPDNADRTCPRTWEMFSHAICNIEDSKQLTISKSVEMIKLLGYGVLDSIPVDTFIQFILGELDDIVEPEVIVETYSQNADVRTKILSTMSKSPPRTDILYAILSRLVAYIAKLSQKDISQNIVKNVILLLEEDTIPYDMKTVIVQELVKGPISPFLVSGKLVDQIGSVF